MILARDFANGRQLAVMRARPEYWEPPAWNLFVIANLTQCRLYGWYWHKSDGQEGFKRIKFGASRDRYGIAFRKPTELAALAINPKGIGFAERSGSLIEVASLPVALELLAELRANDERREKRMADGLAAAKAERETAENILELNRKRLQAEMDKQLAPYLTARGEAYSALMARKLELEAIEDGYVSDLVRGIVGPQAAIMPAVA